MKRYQRALAFLLSVSWAWTLHAKDSSQEAQQPGSFQWGSALRQSRAFLTTQHAYRMADDAYRHPRHRSQPAPEPVILVVSVCLR